MKHCLVCKLHLSHTLLLIWSQVLFALGSASLFPPPLDFKGLGAEVQPLKVEYSLGPRLRVGVVSTPQPGPPLPFTGFVLLLH